jgi:hypothetical protein
MRMCLTDPGLWSMPGGSDVFVPSLWILWGFKAGGTQADRSCDGAEDGWTTYQHSWSSKLMRFVARNDWECGTDTWLAGARMHFCRSRQSFLPRLASKHPWHGRVRGHMGTRRSHGRKHRTLSASQPDQLPQPAGTGTTPPGPAWREGSGSTTS